jgi:hypothetical protein
LLFAALALPAGYYLHYDLQSYSLLIHFADPQADGPLLRWETNAISTQDVTIPSVNGAISARLYVSVGVSHAPGMVVAHGIHHLGMDEPRLASFARAVAGEGYAVLTPQITSLADYRVDSASIARLANRLFGWSGARKGDRSLLPASASPAGFRCWQRPKWRTRRTFERWS